MNLHRFWILALLPLAGCAHQAVEAKPEEKLILVFDCNSGSMSVRDEQQVPEKPQPEKKSGGDTLVADALKPAAPPTPWKLEKQQRKAMHVPAFFAHPEAAVSTVVGEQHRPPAELPHVVLLPRSLPALPPLTHTRTEPSAPEDKQLPTQPLVNLPRVDLEKPVELPALAKFQPERAPLTDVTAEASLAAVLAQEIPVRATPEPFVAIFLPNPFEFRATRLPPPRDEP